jgi:hypothetical protein
LFSSFVVGWRIPEKVHVRIYGEINGANYQIPYYYVRVLYIIMGSLEGKKHNGEVL